MPAVPQPDLHHRPAPRAAVLATARTRRCLLIVPVLLLHGALGWLLLNERLQPRLSHQPDTVRRFVLRLLPEPAAAQPLSQPLRAVPPRWPTPVPLRPTPWPADGAGPQRSGPVPVSPAKPAEALAEASESAPEAAPPPRPAALDLRLQRAASAPLSPAAQAVADPRANSVHQSFAEKLADALGRDERTTEEARGDGRIRVRKGADCVDVREARGAQLDPIGQSTRPTPRLAEACR